MIARNVFGLGRCRRRYIKERGKRIYEVGQSYPMLWTKWSRAPWKSSKIIKQRPAHPANRIRTRWDFSGRSKIAALPVPNCRKLDFTTSKLFSLHPSSSIKFVASSNNLELCGYPPRSRNATRCLNISLKYISKMASRVETYTNRSERWKVKKFPFVQRQRRRVYLWRGW